MADLNYLKYKGEYHYPVDKVARENINKTNEAVKSVENDIKQIKETDTATSWNQLLDRPFYEEEINTPVELYSGAISWSSNQAVLAVSVDTSKEHIIKLDKEYTFTPVAEWVTLGDYNVYFNGTNFTIKYTGTGAPASSVTLTEVTKEVIVHKLDRKYIDMGYKLQELSFKKAVTANDTQAITIDNIYKYLEGREFVYLKCKNGENTLGKFDLNYVYTENEVKTKQFHLEYMGSTPDKSAKHIYNFIVNENNQVFVKYYKTWFQNGNVTTAGELNVSGILIPNVKVEGLE